MLREQVNDTLQGGHWSEKEGVGHKYSAEQRNQSTFIDHVAQEQEQQY